MHLNFVFRMKRARTTYYSAEDVMKFFSEEDEGELDSGTSEEEEAELENQLRIFDDESR